MCSGTVCLRLVSRVSSNPPKARDNNLPRARSLPSRSPSDQTLESKASPAFHVNQFFLVREPPQQLLREASLEQQLQWARQHELQTQTNLESLRQFSFCVLVFLLYCCSRGCRGAEQALLFSSIVHDYPVAWHNERVSMSATQNIYSRRITRNWRIDTDD